MNHRAKPWKVISTKRILVHERIVVDEDTVQLPNGKHTTYVYTPSLEDSVIIVAINSHDEILIQREYSHPPREVMWQLPGGSMKSGESTIDAAQRELSEESGFAARQNEVIGYFYANNRNSNKKQHVVVCRDLYESKLQEDEDEFIENYWLSVEKVHAMIANKEFKNINLLAAMNLWFHITSP